MYLRVCALRLFDVIIRRDLVLQQLPEETARRTYHHSCNSLLQFTYKLVARFVGFAPILLVLSTLCRRFRIFTHLLDMIDATMFESVPPFCYINLQARGIDMH